MSTSFDLPNNFDAYGHLWMAVLRLAVDDATMRITAGTSAEAQSLRARARAWLRSSNDQRGSCQWICDVLNIDIAVIRREFDRRVGVGGINKRGRQPHGKYGMYKDKRP